MWLDFSCVLRVGVFACFTSSVSAHLLHSTLGLLSIKITSPVTHMFSSAMRSVLQTLLGIWIFSDILTTYVITCTFPVTTTEFI